MPRGPLPDAHHSRRNAPTIPTTNLPAGGRAGPAPRIPKGTALGAAGRAWWRWAWSTPQAAAWDAGSFQVVLRRARLEDAVVLLEHFDLGEPPADPDELAPPVAVREARAPYRRARRAERRRFRGLGHLLSIAQQCA